MTPSKKYEIVGLGEILWDLLPSGKQLGGAPANFTCHAWALGAEARLVSRVGEDALGREIIERWAARGLPTDTIEVDRERPTGTVSVELDDAGQPKYTIHERVAWDRIDADGAALEAVGRADAVCFGTLAQRTKSTRAAVEVLLTATRPDALRIFDVNLRPPFVTRDVIVESMKPANVLKLNEHELPVLADIFSLSGSPAEQIAALASRFDLRLVALTRGGEGSLLFADGVCSEHPGLQATVLDTVGAGDAFAAVLTLGLLQRWDLDRINQHANAVAAFVCSQPGATPKLPEALRQPFAGGAQLTSAPVSPS
jgi:fructokinase